MNKRILLWVFLAVVCVAIAGCRSADEDQGSIVYQAVGPDGEPAPELVVTDAGGKELRRMELPAEVSILFPFQFPLSGHVLYEDALGTQEWFLVDVVSDEVQELGSLGLGQDRARPCAFSSDPILLCGEEGIYLLSVDTAQISTVPIELDSTSPVPPLVEWVSPDEAYFLVRVSGGLWLVSAATPGASRRLGLAEGARGASFSDDSAFVEWTYVDLETKTVEKLDGLKGYHKVYGPALPRWLFLTDELVNSQEEHIASLDLKTGEFTRTSP